jgi:hypothetical protein
MLKPNPVKPRISPVANTMASPSHHIPAVAKNEVGEDRATRLTPQDGAEGQVSITVARGETHFPDTQPTEP